jgi:hypothetical protein
MFPAKRSLIVDQRLCLCEPEEIALHNTLKVRGDSGSNLLLVSFAYHSRSKPAVSSDDWHGVLHQALQFGMISEQYIWILITFICWIPVEYMGRACVSEVGQRILSSPSFSLKIGTGTYLACL